MSDFELLYEMFVIPSINDEFEEIYIENEIYKIKICEKNKEYENLPFLKRSKIAE